VINVRMCMCVPLFLTSFNDDLTTVQVMQRRMISWLWILKNA